MGVDFSAVAIDKARRLAAERGAVVAFEVADVTSWEPPTGGFDLVLVFYLQLPAAERRLAMQTAVRAMAPDATLVLVAHDLLNLTEGHGGPQDATVLTTAEGVVDDLAAASLAVGGELVVERAERVQRPVATEDGERTAIDTFVRAHRLQVTPASVLDTPGSA
jgi:hypothetical protein